MNRELIIILGIPVDNLTMDETIARIFTMIDTYHIDKQPKQIATVNVDFLVNTLSWRISGVRHPELLEILRKSDLVTADGMPIVWASKLLGVPLKERVTGADLVPRLAEEAAKLRKSIFFLGGKDNFGEKAAEVLKKQYPELIIAGTDAPFVHADGKALVDADNEDFSIVERINSSGADILLIGFGNPKQEVWFERNRQRLKIPVSIGIGGTYEFITGSVARAPKWIQDIGMEWIFRITQDPGRLWKRYVVGLFKFGFMILPAILDHFYKRLFFKVFNKNNTSSGIEKKNYNGSSGGFINVIKIPNPFDADFVQNQKDNIVSDEENIENTLLNLNRVNFIDSSGIGFILALKRKLELNNKNLFLTGINKTVRRSFETCRILDVFKNNIYSDMDGIQKAIEKMDTLPPFYYFAMENAYYMLFNLHGTLDALQMSELKIDKILNQIGTDNCIFNLKGLTFVDSSGIIFFLKVQKQVSKKDKLLVVCGLNSTVLQMFRITKLDRLFTITDDVHSAEKFIENASF